MKFEMLAAISRNPREPEIAIADLDWAGRVVTFRENGHMWARDGFIAFGERAQEEQEVAEKILAKVRRDHTSKRNNKGYSGVRSSDVARDLNLSRDAFARGVDTMLHQARIVLVDANTKRELDAYPKSKLSTLIRLVKGA